MTFITTRLLSTLLFLLVILFPGSKAAPFSNLPLTDFEFIAAYIIITLIWTTPWTRLLATRRIVPISFAFLILLQVIGHSYLPYGWSVCLRREVATSSLSTPCEPTAQFRHGEPSYIFPHLGFRDNTFPLHFMNDISSLGFYRPGEPDRQTLPYSFSARALFSPEKDTSLTINTSIPDTHVSIDGQTTPLPVNQTTSYILPSDETTQVTISYTTNRNPNEHFNVATSTHPVPPNPNKGIPSNNLILLFRLASGFFWLIIGIALIKPAYRLFTSLSLSSQSAILLFSLAAILFSRIEILPYFFYTLLVLALTWFVIIKKPKKDTFRPFWLIILLVFTVIFINHFTSYQTAVVWTGGSDKLTHVGLSRIIYTAQNLDEFIGDSAFYAQPLHRYTFGLLQMAVGESPWGPFTIQTLIMAASLSWLLILISRHFSLPGGLFYSALLLMISSFEITSPFYLSRIPFQQGLSTPIFLSLFAWLIYLIYHAPLRHNTAIHFVLGLVFSLVSMTRLDLLPAAAGLIPYFIILALRLHPRRKIIRPLAAFTIAFLVFPSLIVLINFLATGEYRLSPTSASSNQLPVFYDIVPRGPSSLTAFDVIKTIVKNYAGHYWELITILIKNVQESFAGPVVTRYLIWWSSPLLAIIALLKSRGLSRLTLITTGIIVSSMIIPGSFFIIHAQGPEMHVHYDILLIFIISISFSVVWGNQEQTNPRNPADIIYTQPVNPLQPTPSTMDNGKNPPHPTREDLAHAARHTLYKKGSPIRRTLQWMRVYACPFEVLIKHIPPNSSVLDVGCGAGLWLGLLAHFNVISSGVGRDPSQPAINLARTMSRQLSPDIFSQLTFICSPAEKAPPANTYDAVSMIDVLHHVNPATQKIALLNAARAVKPGGLLVFKDISNQAGFYTFMNWLHDLIFSRQFIRYQPFPEVESWLKSLGFEKITDQPCRRIWYPHRLQVYRRVTQIL